MLMRFSCIRFLVCASSAPKGSSMRRTSGSVASALAMATRCFIPPESSWTLASANCVSPTMSMSSLDLAWRSSACIPATSRPNSTFRLTDLHGNRAKSWKTMPLSGPGPLHARPSITISPDVGSRSPAIILRRVVLPHPDGPTMLISSPFLMSRSKFSIATVSDTSVL